MSAYVIFVHINCILHSFFYIILITMYYVISNVLLNLKYFICYISYPYFRNEKFALKYFEFSNQFSID